MLGRFPRPAVLSAVRCIIFSRQPAEDWQPGAGWPAACVLSSLAALHAFTGWFGRQEQRLDVLVNNAGVMPGQRTRTVDGVS